MVGLDLLLWELENHYELYLHEKGIKKTINITKTKLTLIPVNEEWSVSYKLEITLRTDSLMKNPEGEDPLRADEGTKESLEWG